ncbi:MAG: amino acid ABC transporter permease [Lachnospiraceae bacterium]|nr:amino acid ABC transporter permease [Lachnospiraceae bacterium]
MEFHFDYLVDSLKYGFMYLPVTVKLALISYAIGVVIGLVIAIVRTYRVPVLTQIFAAFVAIYQGVPTMVALLIYNLLFITCFNDVAAFFRSKLTLADVSTIYVGYVALSLYCIVQISETFRGALKSIPDNQYEAGYSVGLTKVQTLRRIIIPQMIPVAMPGLTNNMVGTIKATALVSAVGIIEVMQGSIIPCGITYSYMEGYAAAAIVYWIFSEVIGLIMRLIEKSSNRYVRRGAV